MEPKAKIKTEDTLLGKRTKMEADGDAPRPKMPRVSQEHRVALNPADCNLDFNVVDDGLKGHALYDKGFAYCWSGARATVGVRGGKYCFACKVVETQPVDMEDTPNDQQHVCRVGISRGDGNVGILGETDHSFGYGGTGKFSNAGKFTDYGTKYSVGDTIICCVNLENSSLAEISFIKNGSHFGVAKRFDSGPKGMGITATPLKTLPWESALFPHVLLKNVIVQMQFSTSEGLVPPEGYKPWSAAFQDGNATLGPHFAKVKDCEVLMMVGLPAAGKTTWAENWVKQHPEKRYMILGTNCALDQMKVPGLLRKNNYGERFEKLMERATGIFNTLLARAARTPRNYILDQTNVYKTARKRKLRPFVGFRKIAVCVFPPAGELKIRANKRFKEMGKEVPADAVNEMLENYVLPSSKDESDELFDEVWFSELKKTEAQKFLEANKSQLRASITKSQENIQEGSLGSVSGQSMSHRGESTVGSGVWQTINAHAADQMSYKSFQNNHHGNSPYLHAPSSESVADSRIFGERDLPVQTMRWQNSQLPSMHRASSMGPNYYKSIDSRGPVPNGAVSLDGQYLSAGSRFSTPYDNSLHQYGRDPHASYTASYTQPSDSYPPYRQPSDLYAPNTGSFGGGPPYSSSNQGRMQHGSYPMGLARPYWGPPTY